MGTSVLIATAVVAGTGLLIGLLLGLAAKLLAVPTDAKTEEIRGLLPGNNCGACGYAGCDGLADAIAKGDAPVNACPVGGQKTADAVAAAMGIESLACEQTVAVVRCSGTCDASKHLYDYYGSTDCHQLALVPGHGSKACAYGCFGLGSCVRACPFEAIHIVRGIAQVDPAKCTGCGRCMDTCPQHLIERLPVTASYVVKCVSEEKGKQVRLNCASGCIGCALCARSCEQHAIVLRDNVAVIDQNLCVGCGVCAEKCPVGVIRPI